METLSQSSTGHHHHGPFKIQMSLTSVVGLDLAKENERLGSIPVTPDPNSSSKVATQNKSKTQKSRDRRSHPRLNKFVRRLHDMLIREKNSGIVEWRRGLLVLFSTDAFSKRILPKYFNTRNFKTFRRQLNYYGFVHVRSFSATGNTTTALWINQHLAEDEANDDVSSVLKLRRVEPDEVAKTVEGRRLRKEQAIHTVEEDIGLNSKTLRMGQIRSMAARTEPTPSRHGHSCDAATAFLRPRGSSFSDCHPNSKISPLHDFEESKTSGSTPVNYYSSNDDDVSTGDTLACRQSIPAEAREEAANTDAAASVLMMLSRS